jgi:hypothetical protein
MTSLLSLAALIGLQTFNNNALETLLLLTSMFILLAGMTFESGVTATREASHTALTIIVGAVLVISELVFVVFLAREIRNSFCFARHMHDTSVGASAPHSGQAPQMSRTKDRVAKLKKKSADWVENPMKGPSIESNAARQASLPPPPPPPPPTPPSRSSQPTQSPAAPASSHHFQLRLQTSTSS